MTEIPARKTSTNEPADSASSDGRVRSREKPVGASPQSRPGQLAPERESTPESRDVPEQAEPQVPPKPTDPVKRALDVVFSLIGLVLTAPAWVILPIWIKLEDGGPVFYAQERVGKGGELFTSLKFRSMVPRSNYEGPLYQAEREKDRITRVGSLMRCCALDELPQLLNILRGDMSLVGPRALLPEEVENHSKDGKAVRLRDLPGYGVRHSVRPGLTGLAQTRIARDAPHRKKFRYDVQYVWDRSLWLDLKLIVRSVVISLLGKWPEVGRGNEPPV